VGRSGWKNPWEKICKVEHLWNRLRFEGGNDETASESEGELEKRTEERGTLIGANLH
jgi:hypothetical protein